MIINFVPIIIMHYYDSTMVLLADQPRLPNMITSCTGTCSHTHPVCVDPVCVDPENYMRSVIHIQYVSSMCRIYTCMSGSTFFYLTVRMC